jgi:cardiolipin synthase
MVELIKPLVRRTARAGGPAHQRLDQFHHAIAGIDIDAGSRVATLCHGLTNWRMTHPGRRDCSAPPTSESPGAQARPHGYIVGCTSRGSRLSIPNLITLGRIILVPIVVWAITSGEMRIAFFLFLAAGISDAVDGFLAKRFHMASELGAYLDPLADKALIVSIYVALGIAGALPISLVILVVSRDIMIISGFMLSWLVDRPMPIKPLPVSKVNTVVQIVLATLVLAEQGFAFNAAPVTAIIIGLVAILTLLSIAFYLAEWLRHMNSFGAGH